jgi:hypothetical protein
MPDSKLRVFGLEDYNGVLGYLGASGEARDRVLAELFALKAALRVGTESAAQAAEH